MRGVRALVVVAVGWGLACQRQIHGTASVYLYNGTAAAARVQLNGTTHYLVELMAGTGELIDHAVAGDYEVVVEQGSKRESAVLKLARDRLAMVNVGAAGCFARADVAGMYSKGQLPVRLQQVFRGQGVITVPETIAVRPGESLPEKRPKSSFGFLRVMVVPCELKDDWQIQDFMMTHR